MSSITQSTDYKRKGVEDICMIKKESEKEEAKRNTNKTFRNETEETSDTEEENESSKGKLTKTIIRKIFDIVSNTDNVKSVVPDLAYLAARNKGLESNTELGLFITGLLKMINEGTKKEDLMKYLEGAVMAVYIIEEAKELEKRKKESKNEKSVESESLNPYKLLNCQGE